MLPKEEIYIRHKIKTNMKKCPKLNKAFQKLLDKLNLREVEDSFYYEKELESLENLMRKECVNKIKTVLK